MKKQANSFLSLTSIGRSFMIRLIHLKSWLLPDRAVLSSLLPSQAPVPLPRAGPTPWRTGSSDPLPQQKAQTARVCHETTPRHFTEDSTHVTLTELR